MDSDLSPALFRIVMSCFPIYQPFWRSPRRRSGFFSSYLSSLLGRDLAEVSGARRPAAFAPLLALLAARSGSLLNLSSLRLGTAPRCQDGRRHIALMQQLGLLVALPAWFGNLGKRVVKAPKVHLADSGLHVHLIGADAQRLARDPDVGGPVLETFVVNELLRQAGWAPDG